MSIGSDSIRSGAIVVSAVGMALAVAAVLWWWLSLPEFTGGTAKLRDALPCLFSPCAPARYIPAMFWVGLLVFMVGITVLLALTSEANEPSGGLLTTIGVIDKFTDLAGTAFAWLSVPLVFVVVYEVVVRKLFDAPTTWAFDLTYMLYGALFMLGAAYALHKGAHIRTDFFWETFSPRTKGWIDSISYVFFFFPGLIALMLIGLQQTNYAIAIHETSEQTPWRPVLWPFKAIIPLACLLLLIQGFSELLKSLYMARTGVELEHKEKVEV